MNKQEIQESLSQGVAEGLLSEIEAYEQANPFDLDAVSMKATYYMLTGEIERAIGLMHEGLKKNPYMLDFLYNLGVLYEISGDIYQAYEYFARLCLIETGQLESPELKRINLKMELQGQRATNEEIEEIRLKMRKLQQGMDDFFGQRLMDIWSYSGEKTLGVRLKTNSEYYIAGYTRLGILLAERSVPYDQAELRKVLTQGNSVKVEIEEPSLVPVLLKRTGNFEIKCGQERFQMYQAYEAFHCYPTDRDLEISGEEGMQIVVGQPMPLTAKPNRKKLILTIFVDGLSQAFLEENGFAESMPKTYHYFADGIRCTNFYSTGEWTYPSMAGYFSGQYTVDHKMFYPKVDYRLPENVELLGECLKRAGYTTAKIDGDWRTNPDYGYVRGFDRVLSGVYGEMMDIKQVISNAVDHIDALKESNQYVYINIGELHDISDNYKLPFDVQAHLTLSELQDERVTGSTSVKQQFNGNKKRRYQEQMRYVDRYLSFLFNYLDETFAPEDILVTLFSDHGQGYLVPNSGFFLADERTKVPLLIKGADMQPGVCPEYISSVDYLPILGKLAGFSVDLTGRRSVLPVFFGGSEKRKFTVSESIYPGDTYKIALRNEDMVFFFETKETVQKDARVSLAEYSCSLRTPAGEEIRDEALMQECLRYVAEHLGYFQRYE